MFLAEMRVHLPLTGFLERMQKINSGIPVSAKNALNDDS